MDRLHRGPLRTLIAAIVGGRAVPGEQLPREADLAEQFGVSRATSREFIRGLEERGLISVKHGRGATVNPPELWDKLDADVLAALLAGERRLKLLGDFLEMRRIFEIQAAGLAAERADASGVARLRAGYERMQQAAGYVSTVDPDGERTFHEADVAFHRTLVELTGNETLTALSGRIHGAMLETRQPLARPRLRLSHTLPEHERIVRAVAKGSPAAATRAMQQHLDSVGGYLEEHAAEQQRARSSA
jgi:GntR family transcriptional repressor for pyruvate dehydrogenase complex